MNQPMPIIIPMETRQRDCVVLHGQRYCAENSDHEVGVALIAGSVIMLYVGFLIWLFVEKDKTRLAVIGFLAPMFFGGLYLVFK